MRTNGVVTKANGVTRNSNVFRDIRFRQRCTETTKQPVRKTGQHERCKIMSAIGDTKCHWHGGVDKFQAEEHRQTFSQGKKCSRIKRNGEPCKHWAIQGGPVCWDHGGATRQVRNAANRRINDQQARRAMIVLGEPVVGLDPFDALMEEIARTAGHVRWLEAQIRGVSVRELIWGTTSIEKSVGDDPKGNFTIVKEEAVPNVWYGLYRKEREHLVYVCKTAIQCGIAERTVNLMEQQGMIIARVLEAALNDVELALNAAQHEAAKHIIGRHLRLVAGPDPNPESVAS